MSVSNEVSLKHRKMETRIQKTLLHWFPEAFKETEKSLLSTDYGILRHFAEYAIRLLNEPTENQKEPFKIIQLLYSRGSLYERNAIENEFFNVLASGEKALTLKGHLDLMPEEIKTVYIKTIIEN